jgi:hypothetical protein
MMNVNTVEEQSSPLSELTAEKRSGNSEKFSE